MRKNLLKHVLAIFVFACFSLNAFGQGSLGPDPKLIQRMNELGIKMQKATGDEKVKLIKELMKISEEITKQANKINPSSSKSSNTSTGVSAAKAAVYELFFLIERVAQGKVEDIVEYWLREIEGLEVPKEKLQHFYNASTWLAISLHDAKRAMKVAQSGIDQCDARLKKGDRDWIAQGDDGIFFQKLGLMRAKALAFSLQDKMDEAKETIDEMANLAWSYFIDPNTKSRWLSPMSWGFATLFQQGVFPILESVQRIHGEEEVAANWLPWAESILASEALILSAFQKVGGGDKTILDNYQNMFLQGKAQILLSAGNAAKALETINKYPFERKDPKLEPYVMYPMMIKARALSKSGQNEQALKLLSNLELLFQSQEKSKSIGGLLLIGYSRWWPTMMSGEILEKERKFGEAIKAYQKSAGCLKKLYNSIKSSAARREYIKESDKVYSRLVRLQLEAGKPQEALQTVEEAQSKAMLDLFEDVYNRSRKDWPEDLKKRRQKIKSDLDNLESTDGAKPTPGGKSRSIQVSPDEKRAKSQKLMEDLSNLEDEAENRGRESSSKASTTDSWRKSLLGEQYFGKNLVHNNDITTILFLVKEDPCWAMVIGNGKIIPVKLAADSTKIRSVANKFRKAVVAGRDDWQKPSSELYQHLFQPIWEQIKDRERLMIFPEGILWYVPFGAILDQEQKPLASRFRLGIASGMNLMTNFISMEKGGGKRPSKPKLLVLANPDGSLPNAQIEGKSIAELAGKSSDWSSEVWEGEKAKKSEFLREVEQKDKYFGLHFATHGVLDDLNPLHSFLVFSEKDDTGQFKVSEISHLNLSNMGLAVLSACNTAMGAISGGNEVVGIQSAFQEAGVTSVIASLWEVSDESTAKLMGTFYENLFQGKNIPESLPIAIRGMTNQHPSKWAPFQLYGLP
ncbi:CHAT domain-containing protein [bacterium]|nr:CHAT domain-containing protein [bacterium]